MRTDVGFVAKAVAIASCTDANSQGHANGQVLIKIWKDVVDLSLEFPVRKR